MQRYAENVSIVASLFLVYYRFFWTKMNLVYKDTKKFTSNLSFHLNLSDLCWTLEYLTRLWIFMEGKVNWYWNLLGSRLGEPLALRFDPEAKLVGLLNNGPFDCNKLLTVDVPLVAEFVRCTLPDGAAVRAAPLQLDEWFIADESSYDRLKKLACKATKGWIRRLGSYSSICWTSSLNFM